MFSAWALEIAQIKGVVSVVVSPWVHLFCLPVLIWSFVLLHCSIPPLVDLDHFYMLLYLPNSSDLRSYFTSTFDSSLVQNLL